MKHSRIHSILNTLGILAGIALTLVLFFDLNQDIRDAAKDAVTGSEPTIPEHLIDEEGRAISDIRGEVVGASPSTVYPTPQLFLADYDIKYEFHQSPNWSSRGFDAPEGVVMHITGEGSCPGMTNWFQNPAAQVSAHFGVCKDGSVLQYVPAGDSAWHAGRIADNPDVANPFIAELVSTRSGTSCRDCNEKTIGIEVLLAVDEKLSDFPEMQRSLTLLMRWINQDIGIEFDRDFWIGHYQLDPRNRGLDPRCCYDIDRQLEIAVEGATSGSTPTPTPEPTVTPPDPCCEECEDLAYDREQLLHALAVTSGFAALEKYTPGVTAERLSGFSRAVITHHLCATRS